MIARDDHLGQSVLKAFGLDLKGVVKAVLTVEYDSVPTWTLTKYAGVDKELGDAKYIAETFEVRRKTKTVEKTDMASLAREYEMVEV